jgi:hypothetical protein
MNILVRFFAALRYIIPLALIALVLWAAASFRLHQGPSESAVVLAPEIQGDDIDGVPFKLSDYRGKVVVLDFWGNW